ncbi:hypothetical protein [Thalassolituus sp.]|uniref:hypothetical protein n=1 Tax=Thalassolituus sp. TaxID=2030822 RepID=UPI0035149CB2
MFKPLFALTVLSLSTASLALQAISERELSDVAAQAFISVDSSSYSEGGETWDFRRINLGLDIQTLLTADELVIGEFERSYGDGDGTAPMVVEGSDGSQRTVEFIFEDGEVKVPSADLILENFALGGVKNPYSENPEVDAFHIRDPYIELAYKDNEQGIRQVVGFRMGFGKSQGYLSADLLSVTGNFQAYVTGIGRDAYNSACEGPDASGSATQCLLLSAATGSVIYSPIELLDGYTGNALPDGTDEGIRYVKRATWAGVPTGGYFSTNGWLGGILPLLKAKDCEISGVRSCLRTGIYQSIYLGLPEEQREEGATFDDTAARGVFFSLQSGRCPGKTCPG